MPDLTQLCSNLLPLLKQKEVKEYVWTSGCQDDFTRIKEALSAGTILGIFDPEWETSLWIDFSKVGLGLALTQEHPRDRSMKKLIWCSSHRFRTQWEPKLPPIYGESRAANWAVRSCSYWLHGIETFKIKTDHKALSTVFTKEWEELSEELQEYVRGLQGYNFTMEFVPGRNNSLADYLRRYPA